MPRELIVIGGGQHARVLIDVARSCSDRWQVIGYLDEHVVEETAERFGVRWLGNDHQSIAAHPRASFILGIGGLAAPERARIARLYEGRSFATLVARDASVSPTAIVADGAVVLARAIVNTGARVGAHAIVNSGAIVEHDVELGDYVHVGPGVAIGGGARIGAGTHIGLGACVRDHVRVGKNVVIGMGAAVVRDVPDDATVVGVPAVERG
jgi:acetyltransferase EpsM